MTLNGNNAARLPLPVNVQCCVTVKVERALGKSRTTVGDPAVLPMCTTDTFNVMTAKVFDVVDGLIVSHHDGPSTDRLLWGPQTPWETYVKVALNAPQRKYVALTGENYHDMIQKVWDNAGKTRTGQASFFLQLFVYDFLNTLG